MNSTYCLDALCRTFTLKQPLSFVLDYQGYKIGLSHTIPILWNWGAEQQNNSKVVASLLWDREFFNKGKGLINHGVDFSIHGHNSTQVPLWIDNSYHIDTSFYGGPTMIDLQKTIKYFANQ